MSSPDVIVVGAGVLGLCTAAELAGRGHAVTVIDPGETNASAIAAGMIAPALESLLEDAEPGRAAFLKRARDLWPDFAQRHDVELLREGADWRGPGAVGRLHQLRELGFEAEPIDGGLTTPDDWRIDPTAVLDNLARTVGVTILKARARSVRRGEDGWTVEIDSGEEISAPWLVMATGAAASLSGLPAGVANRIDAIEPIKGQLTRVRIEGPARVVRGPSAYVVPAREGVLIGATMQHGARDLTADQAEADRQVAAGLQMLALETQGVAETHVGIRGAVPDGLPLAGGAGEPGLSLALAPRRNGWLLGPLVGRVIADQIEGRAPLADAAALDPLRFG